MLALIVVTRGDKPTDGYSASTLIGTLHVAKSVRPGYNTGLVTPKSVMSNWQKQIEDHCTPGTLKVAVYYGDHRNLTTQELQTYDVVVTTYETVKGEYGNHVGLSSSKGKLPKKRRRHENSLMITNWKVRAMRRYSSECDIQAA